MCFDAGGDEIVECFAAVRSPTASSAAATRPTSPTGSTADVFTGAEASLGNRSQVFDFHPEQRI